MTGDIYAVNHSITGERMYRGQVVLTYAIQYPQFVTFSSMLGLRRINGYYKQQARELADLVQEQMYRTAVEDYVGRQEEGFPFSPYELDRPFTMTYGERNVVSLYLDDYRFTGGAHGNTLRTSNTWNALTGQKIPLSALFRPGVNYQERILEVILHEVQRRAEEEPGTYDENVEELVVESFQEKNFYLTPEGIVIYYQQYEIAPYSTGIPTFLIPYGLVGARIPGG